MIRARTLRGATSCRAPRSPSRWAAACARACRRAEAEKAAQDAPGYYPPTLTGMRGSHPGAFEAAHEVRDGDFWNNATTLIDTKENYDLVVVGAGIGGLVGGVFLSRETSQAPASLSSRTTTISAATPSATSSHVDGRVVLANGGTQDMDSPTPYREARCRGLMKALGIDPVEAAQGMLRSRDLQGSRDRACSSTRRRSAVDKLVRVDTGDGTRRVAAGGMDQIRARTRR